MTAYFDGLSELNPLDPEAKKYGSFMEGLDALRAIPKPQAAQAQEQMPQAEEVVPPEVLPPEQPGHIMSGLKGIAGAATDLVASGAKGLGIMASDRINENLVRLARVSPLAENLIYAIGAGDDTLQAEQSADLEAQSAGRGDLAAGDQTADVRDTSALYQQGAAFQAGSYAALNITPEVQQKVTYKITNAVSQGLGYAAAGAAGAVAGGAAGAYATIGTLMATNTVGSEYDRVRGLGGSHEEALGQAEDVAVVTGVLSMLSLSPLVGAASKAGVAAGVGKTSFSSPITAAVEQAFVKRGFNVRNPMTRRGITAVAAGPAEGLEEYATGVYTDVRAKFYGKNWAPNKTWAQILYGPDRAEEFALGVVGGAGAATVLGGKVEFTEDRKAAAAMQYKQALEARGEPAAALVTPEVLEPLFRRAEAQAEVYQFLDQEGLAKAIEEAKSNAENAEIVEEEVESLMLLDALTELLPHAKVTSKNVDAEEARDAVRAAEDVDQVFNDSEAEEAAVSKSILDVLKYRGFQALGALETSVRGVMENDKVAAVHKRAAAAASRAISRVRNGQKALQKETQEEAQAEQMEQQARDLEVELTTEELRTESAKKRDELLRAWPNEEKRNDIIHRMMREDVPFTIEATGRQVDGPTILSAMMEMGAPMDGVPEGTLMRDVIAQSLVEEDATRQQEMEEQIAALEGEAEKQALEEQKQDQKNQSDDAQVYLQALQMDAKIKDINRKAAEAQLQGQVTEAKLQADLEKIESDKRIQKKKEEQAARKEKEALTKKAGESVESSLRKGKVDEAKGALRSMPPKKVAKVLSRKVTPSKSTKKPAPKKVDPRRQEDKANNVETVADLLQSEENKLNARQTQALVSALRKGKLDQAMEILRSASTEEAGRKLSTRLGETQRTKKEVLTDKANGIETVGDMLLGTEGAAEAMAHRMESQKKEYKPSNDDPVNDSAKSPNEEIVEMETEPVHKGKDVIIMHGGKRVRARSGPTFRKSAAPGGVPMMVTMDMKQQLLDKGFTMSQIKKMTPSEAHNELSGELMMNWEMYTKDEGWQKQEAISVAQFKKLATAAKHGPPKVPTSGNLASGGVGGTIPPINVNHSPTQPPSFHSKGKKVWGKFLDQIIRLGDVISWRLGPLGSLVRTGGLESERMSQVAQGKRNDDIERATEVSSKEHRAVNGVRARSNKGNFRKWFQHMLGITDLEAALTTWRSETQSPFRDNQIKHLEESLSELGFNPASLGRRMPVEDIAAIKKYAKTKADEWDAKPVGTGDVKRQKEQMALYWNRYFEYLEDLETFSGEVTVMYHLDSVPNPDHKVHLMPLVAARHHENLAYSERRKAALQPKEMAGKVPNHVHNGLSTDFRDQIKKNSPEFKAELDYVVGKLTQILLDTTSPDSIKKADKLYLELNVSRTTSPDQINKRIERAGYEALAGDSTSVFARQSHKFGSFVRARQGVWGPSIVDWSYDAGNAYLDKAYRDVAEHQMYRDFWTIKADPGQDQEYKYHTENIGPMIAKGDLGTVEFAKETLMSEARRLNPDFNVQWLADYLNEIRGRSMGDGNFQRELVGSIASYQYVTKLGNPATLIRNASILGSMAMVLGPRHMQKTLMGIRLPWSDAGRQQVSRAKTVGAASHSQDAAFEFQSHLPSNAGAYKKTTEFLSKWGLFMFTKEEQFLRTIVSHASLSAFTEHVNLLQGTGTAGTAKLMGLSIDEARHNLKKMFEFSDSEIDQIAEGVSPEVMEEFEDRAMYYGSNLINFRSGPNFLPHMLVGQGFFQRYLRVFNSFAYNAPMLMAKHVWMDIGKGLSKNSTPGQLRGGIRRLVNVMGGTVLTASVVNALLDAVGDTDDKDDLEGDSDITQFAFNRMRDMSTVGMFGKLDRPYDMAYLQNWLGGVHFRTLTNITKGMQGVAVSKDDFFSGEFTEGAKQLYDTAARFLTEEVTHLKGARTMYRKYGVNRRDYDIARQVQFTLAGNKKSTKDKMVDVARGVNVSSYQKERDAMVNALASGLPGDAADAARTYVRRLIKTKPGMDVDKAVTSVRAAVMSKAPLSEFSTTTDPKKAQDDLGPFMLQMRNRRGTADANRLMRAHLVYTAMVAKILENK